LIAFSLMGMLTVAVGWLIIKGVGIWGINIPIGWDLPSSISCGG